MYPPLVFLANYDKSRLASAVAVVFSHERLKEENRTHAAAPQGTRILFVASAPHVPRPCVFPIAINHDLQLAGANKLTHQ